MFQITNDAGRRFQVRVIARGERYGLNDCLLHDSDDSLIEFIDAAPGGPRQPSGNGSFVARYPARAFLDRGEAELWLFGQDVAWRLAPAQVHQVREWLARRPPSGPG